MILIVCLLGACCASAQVGLSANALIYSTEEDATYKDSSALFNIKHIILNGNKRTREATILRELSFQEGEQYLLNELVDKFAETKKQLMNTGLFRSVVVSLNSLQGYDVYVSITMEERWYLYPIPFVRVVDRNFNEWVVKQGMNLNRVNYGLKLTHNNTTGRNDRLELYFVNGFTKQVAIRYNNLFLDREMKWNIDFDVAWGKNHEVTYNTINDKQVAYKNNNEFVHSFFRTGMRVSYRRAIKTKHTFGVSYNYDNVDDTLFHLNPSYSAQKKVVRFPELSYTMRHNNVDFIPYPRDGYIAELGLIKRGFTQDMNLWQLTAKASGWWPLSHKYYFNLRLAGMLKAPFKQSYITKHMLGYNDMYMQGFEYNVIDGVLGGYAKAIMARQLINTAVRIPSKKIDRLNHMPIAVYAKVYGNAGYVYDPSPGYNQLKNRMLYSSGVGLDFVLLTNFVFKLEYSLNRFGQKDLYLHHRDHF